MSKAVHFSLSIVKKTCFAIAINNEFTRLIIAVETFIFILTVYDVVDNPSSFAIFSYEHLDAC